MEYIRKILSWSMAPILTLGLTGCYYQPYPPPAPQAYYPPPGYYAPPPYPYAYAEPVIIGGGFSFGECCGNGSHHHGH